MFGWFEKYNKLSLLIALVIAVGIFYISSLTFGAVGKGGVGILGTLYHILAFFFFALFLMIFLVKGKEKMFFIVGILMAVLYGISDEIHQFFVPGRCMSLHDVFLDSVGIALAFLIYFVVVESRSGRKYQKSGSSGR